MIDFTSLGLLIIITAVKLSVSKTTFNTEGGRHKSYITFQKPTLWVKTLHNKSPKFKKGNHWCKLRKLVLCKLLHAPKLISVDLSESNADSKSTDASVYMRR